MVPHIEQDDNIPFSTDGGEVSTEFKSDVGVLRYLSTHHISPKNTAQASIFGGLHSLVISPDGRDLISIGRMRYFVELSTHQRLDNPGKLRIERVSLYDMKYTNGSSMAGNTTGWDSPGGLAVLSDKAESAFLVAYNKYLLKFPNGLDSTKSEMIETGRAGECPTGGPPQGLHVTDEKSEELLVFCDPPNAAAPSFDIYLMNLVNKEFKAFQMERDRDYRVVDIARLPNGDFLVLSRMEPPRTGAITIDHISQSDIAAAGSSKPTILGHRRIAKLSSNDGYKIDGMSGIAALEDPTTHRIFIYTLSDNSLDAALSGTVLWVFEWQPSSEKGIGQFSLTILTFFVCGILIAIVWYRCCRRAQIPPSLQRLRGASGRRILGRRSAAAEYYRGEFSSSDDDDNEVELATVPIRRTRECKLAAASTVGESVVFLHVTNATSKGISTLPRPVGAVASDRLRSEEILESRSARIKNRDTPHRRIIIQSDEAKQETRRAIAKVLKFEPSMPASNDAHKCTRILLLIEAIVATVLLILGFVLIAAPILILALITSLCAAAGCLCNPRGMNRNAESGGADVGVITVPSPTPLRDSLGLTLGERNRLLLDTTSPPQAMQILVKRRAIDESSRGKPSMQIENDSCSICLLPYLEGDSFGRQLPCGHIFHVACIDSWADKQAVCPLCRESFSKGFDTKGTIFQAAN
ncbi:hypothetical protein FOL47_007224 [Perkinsus chesapeaki]|uniref:RING-type domain-containing protein n=1 Tax=Perkinsus chesapeaki TaxID=330153 RepID=A0A7J6LM77_PERCH|nr:hypothetical protein FOL47_007224 [Perkinsus chesapeaki]